MAAALALLSASSGTALAAEGPIALRLAGGWTAKLFVEPLARPAALAGEPSPRRDVLAMNARASRPLARGADLSVEVTNLLDRDAPGTQGLLPPSPGRGFLVRLRKTF